MATPAGTATATDALFSAGYSAGLDGWLLATNGNAEFNNVSLRGALYIAGGTAAGGVDLDSNGLKIDAFPAGAFHVPETQPRTIAWLHNGVAYSWIRGEDQGRLYLQSLASQSIQLNQSGGVITINGTSLDLQTTANGANLRWGTTNGQLFQVTSSLRWKDLLGDVDPDTLTTFDKLRPIRFRSKHEQDDGRVMLGFGAEHLNRVWPEATYKDAQGEVVEVDERQILALTVAKVQQLSGRVAALEKELAGKK